MFGSDITKHFSLDEVDHEELQEILRIRYKTSWRVARDEFTFPAAHKYALKLELQDAQIVKITEGEASSPQELRELLEQVEADLKDERIAEYGVEVLFAHRPVAGGFRFGCLPMQILPPPPEAPRPQYFGEGDHPFVLEYPMRAYRTPELRLKRRYNNAVKWARILNALLIGSIGWYSNPRPRRMWATKANDIESPSFWVNRAFDFPGRRWLTNELSEQGVPLPIVPADAYFGGARSRAQLDASMDTFFVPDNLDQLVAAFLKLDGARKPQFLRCVSSIYIARELWDISVSSYFIACVQAIETLVGRSKRDRTKLFKQFVNDYCKTTETDQEVVDNLYKVRSNIVHGSYLFQLDETPGFFNLAASSQELETFGSALTLAKNGLRNWLLSQGKTAGGGRG
jgi:hypothetical protein